MRPEAELRINFDDFNQFHLTADLFVNGSALATFYIHRNFYKTEKEQKFIMVALAKRIGFIPKHTRIKSPYFKHFSGWWVAGNICYGKFKQVRINKCKPSSK